MDHKDNLDLSHLETAVYLRKSRMEEGLATEEVLAKHQKTLYDHAAAHGIRYFLMVAFAGAVWPLTFRWFRRLGGEKAS